jgi:hypothetical protein
MLKKRARVKNPSRIVFEFIQAIIVNELMMISKTPEITGPDLMNLTGLFNKITMSDRAVIEKQREAVTVIGAQWSPMLLSRFKSKIQPI